MSEVSVTVTVDKLPKCDIHYFQMNGKVVTARYDGKTDMGPWAYMCEFCFQVHGLGLGTGYGHKLIVEGEK